MKTSEILSIVALSMLGICLISSLVKMAVKNDKTKEKCDQLCGVLFFVAVVLVGVSQLLDEINLDTFKDWPNWTIGVGANPQTFSAEKRRKSKGNLGVGLSNVSCQCCSLTGGNCAIGTCTSNQDCSGDTNNCIKARQDHSPIFPAQPCGPAPAPPSGSCGTNGCCNPKYTDNAQECGPGNSCPGNKQCYYDGTFGCPDTDQGCNEPPSV